MKESLSDSATRVMDGNDKRGTPIPAEPDFERLDRFSFRRRAFPGSIAAYSKAEFPSSLSS
jgi:hypothetical protein